MKIPALVLVRTGSSRLPEKALLPLGETTVIEHLIARLKRAQRISDIVLTTTLSSADDILEEIARRNAVKIFRGSESDVLSRLARASREAGSPRVAVIFGDCPLLDPEVVDHVIEATEAKGEDYDFVGNDLATSFPPGMEVEVVSTVALGRADEREKDASIREHGTLHIRRESEYFRRLNLEAPHKWRRPELEMELDTWEDYEVIRSVVGAFHPSQDYGLEDIIRFLDTHPELKAMNRQVTRRWKEYRDGK